jgi:Sulfatase-modifying factor enzyme 1
MPEVTAAGTIIIVIEDGESTYVDAYRTPTARRSCAPSLSVNLRTSESRWPSPRRSSAVNRSRRASTSESSRRVVSVGSMPLLYVGDVQGAKRFARMPQELRRGPSTCSRSPSNANSIARQAGATVFLPSENEWYKAAYNNPGGSTYNLYPTSSNMTPTASSPTAIPNHANFSPGGPGNLTDVGAYSGTTSPYGAFDMGGNVWQWNEALINGSFRGLRGGSFYIVSNNLLSSIRNSYDPASGSVDIGFRVASTIPDPSTGVLAAVGFAGLVVLGWRRRKR